MLFLGDSTGNDITEWAYLLSTWLASRLPAYSTSYRLWNNTNQAYDYETVMRRGYAGDRYAVLGATPSARVACADSAAFDVTDLDIRIFLTADDYTPASALSLCGRYGASDPNRAWFLHLGTDGKLTLYWYPNGNAASQKTATSTAAVTTVFANGQTAGLRVTLDVDNGADGYDAKFWTCPTPAAGWTQLGNTVTGAATTALPDVTWGLYVGYGNAYGLDAKYHQFEMMSGVSGHIVAALDFDMFDGSTLTFGDAAGNAWTINKAVTSGGSIGLLILNGHIGGATMASISAQLAAMTPAVPGKLFLINLGHNQLGGDMTSDYQALIDAVLARYAAAEPFVIVQNPQKTDAPGYATHTVHMNQVRALAVAQGYRYADAYTAFQAVPSWETALMTDGAHPNATGSQLEANVVKSRLLRR